MTTQSNVSNPVEVAPAQPFNWPLALAILALGLILGSLATNLAILPRSSQVSVAPKLISQDSSISPNMVEVENKANIATGVKKQRALEAEAARYNGIATQAETQRALDAEAARYNSMGLFYAGGKEAERQQAIAAEAARYSGMATQAETQRALEAEAARYTGLVEFYGGNVTPSASETLLSIYHQSEWTHIPNESHTLAWPPRPTQFHPVENVGTRLDEIALSTYHQSEWGHKPQAVEAKTDGDIGLMEFPTK